MAPDTLPPNALRTSDAGIDFLKRFQRFSRTPYAHPCGLPAIGYEHIVRPIDQKLTEVNEAQATQLLREDVRVLEIYLNASARVPLAAHEFDALISLMWDVGILEYERSPLREMLHTVCKPLVATAIEQYGLPAVTERRYRARRAGEATLFSASLSGQSF
jgi:GH24 family phage-related lysozyme (muramidase)